MIHAGIAGASGYTGVELVKLLSNHPDVELTAITSNSYKEKSLTEIFPSMRGFENFKCEALDPEKLKGRIDVIFLALPHKVSMLWAPRFLALGIKVIDLSADYRFSDQAAYEAAYQPHSSGELLKESVYGLCEIYRDQIRESSLIGNPGCYPTSILLPLIPLLQNNLIKTKGIISDSKSGVSGAGRGLALGTHFCEVNESFHPYKVGNHRHTPEINEILSIISGKTMGITFVPHLLPVTRGMLSTIYVQARENILKKDILQTFHAAYKNENFIRLLAEGQVPDILHVKRTNCCDIGFHMDENTGQIVLISAIDNLLKGAAGQAVQNMNIMFEIEEKAGLDGVSAYL